MKSILIILGAIFVTVACALGGFVIYNRSRGIPIDLPHERAKEDSSEAQRVRIEVVGGGRVRVEGVEMALSEMEVRAISDNWKSGPGVSIISSATSLYTDSIAVLDVIRRAGIERVDIQTEMRK